MSEQTQTPAPFDYDAANTAAATSQGLAPVVTALTEAGIAVAVEQTGGWTMVATVTVPGGVAAILEDGSEIYAVSQYRGRTWTKGEEEYGYKIVTGTEAMVAEVRRFIAEISAAHAAEED
jgi:hypothetical protein